ncbi:MAG: hypothetical protein N3B21_17590 [Clostridia bacterium]|nr:hypothetical protein [Clostridia bacterium]
MEGNFYKYLFYIGVILFSLLGVLWLILRKVKGRARAKQSSQAIDSGSVSILFDKDENVTIIPYSKDKFGVGRAVGSPQFLNKPYNKENLGAIVKHSMNLSRNNIPCTDSELMSGLKSTGWKEFSYGKRNISIHYHEGYGIVFNTTRRNVDGAYQFNYHGFERIAPADVKNKELGEIILELLQRCRC